MPLKLVSHLTDQLRVNCIGTAQVTNSKNFQNFLLEFSNALQIIAVRKPLILNQLYSGLGYKESGP